MKITITILAQNGNLIVYLINSNGTKVLSLHDNETGECLIVPGIKYRFEWHVWSPTNADYSIVANVNPPNQGFPPFNWTKSYPEPHQDMGAFDFTI